MATLSLYRTSEKNVTYSVSGATAGHTYRIDVYYYNSYASQWKWSTKVNNLVGSTSYFGYLTVGDNQTYTFRLWDSTISGQAASATLEPYATPTVEVKIYNYFDNVSAPSLGLSNGHHDLAPGTSFRIADGSLYQKYSAIYDFKYYTLSNASGQYTNPYQSIMVVAGLYVNVYYETRPVTISAWCDAGVSSYRVTSKVNGSNYITVSSTSTGLATLSIKPNTGVSIGSITVNSGYKMPYLLSQNSASDLSGWHGPTSFTGAYTSLDTSYNRRIKVGATLTLYYPYTQRVYIDGAFTEQDSRSDNTNNQVTISSLSLYQRYAGYSNDYEFQYALVGSSSTRYTAYNTVTLTASTTTTIYLYFQRKIKSVAPVISSVSTTRRAATVNWSKNGGQSGSWILYYGTSTSSMQSIAITSSPVTVAGLSPGQAYTFYVRNSASSSDYKDSNSVSAATLALIGAFAWTSSDAVYIVKGQPVKNLTASAWSTLIGKVAICGGTTSAIPSASVGTRITASHFNQMRSAILSLPGAGSIADSVSSGNTVIKATTFANHDLSLKNAINRAIANSNSQ